MQDVSKNLLMPCHDKISVQINAQLLSDNKLSVNLKLRAKSSIYLNK